MKRLVSLAALATASVIATASAQSLPDSFVTGPVLEDFGPAAQVESDLAIPDDIELKLSFDIAEAGEPGTVNRRFVTVARFINMHAAAGVPVDQIKPAIVVHGPAAASIMKAPEGETNPTAPLIAALIEQDVPIYLCGQTLAARGIGREDLLPGVQVALSAMTAHAILASQGYTINPF